MSLDYKTLKFLKSRNSNSPEVYKDKKNNNLNNKKINKRQSINKNIYNKKVNKNNELEIEKNINKKEQKYLASLNTTRDSSIVLESSKKSNYYDKFINYNYSDFSEQDMRNKLKKEKIEDMEFLNSILYDNNYNLNENQSQKINNENCNAKLKKNNKYKLNDLRKYIIKIEKRFKEEAEKIINKNISSQNFILSYYFLMKLENLIARFSLIIFIFIKINRLEQARDIFLLMLKENMNYIDYIENNIIEWYSTSKKRINIVKDFPKCTYELIRIYSFIIKYSRFFNMASYSNIFLGRYLDIIYFIYNFFIYKSNIRGFIIDSKNQLNFWLSLGLNNAYYYSIAYYFPLNIPINLNNYIINLYKKADESNLTKSEKIMILKTLYNSALVYYLNDQKDKALNNLYEVNDGIVNSEEFDFSKTNILKQNPSHKDSISNLFGLTSKNNESFLFNNETEGNRISTATTRSENNGLNANKNTNIDYKSIRERIKATFSKDKINLEDILLLINYGVKSGIMNENNSGTFKQTIIMSPTNLSQKCRLQYLSIPKYFNNPLLRKVELLIGEIELDRKNYYSAYDHILKAFYILILLKLNKKGSEYIMFNYEQKIIKKYLALIDKIKEKENNNNLHKSEINILDTTLNQSIMNNTTDIFQENYKEELGNSILDKYNINIEESMIINKKKENEKKDILICGADYKILKEIEKFFIFLSSLSLYQIKILNETQPENDKKDDLPILFSSQFKDCLSNIQRIELDNLQTMALNRFMILKDTKKWIMPNNLNIGIIDENNMKKYLNKKTMKFLNKYYEQKNNETPIRKTREYKYYQEIIKSEKTNKDMQKFIHDNFELVLKILKRSSDNEIQNIINFPNTIIAPVKLFKKKRKKKLKNGKNENSYRPKNRNNYDFDDNYDSDYRLSSRIRTYSTKYKCDIGKNMTFNRRIKVKNNDDFFQRFSSKKGKRNKSLQSCDYDFYFNGDLKSSKKDKKDYNDSYKDFLLSIEDSDSIED